MEKNLIFSYDKEGDILDISLGKPQKAISEEIEEDVFVRLEPKTKKIIGFMILNFTRKFGTFQRREKLPITGHFEVEKDLIPA